MSLKKRVIYQYCKLSFKIVFSGFEKIACNILDISNDLDDDSNKTEILLIRKTKDFYDITCLQMAIKADCKDFLSHPVCQNLLKKIWYQNILPDNSIFLVYFFFD